MAAALPCTAIVGQDELVGSGNPEEGELRPQLLDEAGSGAPRGAREMDEVFGAGA